MVLALVEVEVEVEVEDKAAVLVCMVYMERGLLQPKFINLLAKYNYRKNNIYFF